MVLETLILKVCRKSDYLTESEFSGCQIVSCYLKYTHFKIYHEWHDWSVLVGYLNTFSDYHQSSYHNISITKLLILICLFTLLLFSSSFPGGNHEYSILWILWMYENTFCFILEKLLYLEYNAWSTSFLRLWQRALYLLLDRCGEAWGHLEFSFFCMAHFSASSHNFLFILNIQ